MTILCLHQGFELYGSDRSFIESVRAIREALPEVEIEVILPREGPIVEYLIPYATRVSFEPLWILRRHSFSRLVTTELLRFPSALLRAFNRMRRADLVYINTSVVLDYTIVARLFPRKTIIHVHEIPEGAAVSILGRVLRWSRAEIIFNSRATKTTFPGLRGLRSHVIYNGVAAPADALPVTYDGQRPLKILMLGRINRIKGQEVLLDALAALPHGYRERVAVRMVGSAFETDALEVELRERVVAMGLDAGVRVLPFIADPSPHYAWADIVVVPSRRPESLGRVAIEAMAHGRPPLVSDIGGLGEVVEDGRTGWLVPPGNAAALSARIVEIIDRPEHWRAFAPAGRERYQALFSETAVSAAIGQVVTAKLDAARKARLRPTSRVAARDAS